MVSSVLGLFRKLVRPLLAMAMLLGLGGILGTGLAHYCGIRTLDASLAQSLQVAWFVFVAFIPWTLLIAALALLGLGSLWSVIPERFDSKAAFVLIVTVVLTAAGSSMSFYAVSPHSSASCAL
jgi:hypothetical protein